MVALIMWMNSLPLITWTILLLSILCSTYPWLLIAQHDTEGHLQVDPPCLLPFSVPPE